MKFKLEIKMDNAAFDSPNGFELALILERLSKRLIDDQVDPGEGGDLRDTNGNTVGEWRILK